MTTARQGSRSLRLSGRVLYLTRDEEALRRQLAGGAATEQEKRELIDDVSTDELTPGWVCYFYDATLGQYCLVGLRGGVVREGDIARGGFEVIVSGRSKGCGSSRETAPYAELAAGIKLVVAESVEKIYAQNAQNIGLLVSTDLGVPGRLERGEAIDIAEFTRGLDPISAQIVEHGGLFAYSRARVNGHARVPTRVEAARPMTMAEKIIAAHAVGDHAAAGSARPERGARVVQPGDALFVRADVRFSHEYVTPMAEALFCSGFGADARVHDPESVFAFRDHLTLLHRVIPQAHVERGLDRQAASLATVQERFAARQGIKLYGEVERPGRSVGSEAICHNKVIEEIALPGQVVVGSDSHTCMAGALGCFAFGVGATDLANAWLTSDVRLKVPETIHVVLRGRLASGVCAKDVMLHLLAQPLWRGGGGIGKVLEFGGEGLTELGLDERATLANMSVEAGGFTGIMEADELVVDYLVAARGLDAADVRSRVVRSDAGAVYAATCAIDLAAVVPMVALPGDPRQGITLDALRALRGEVRIDIAYGGSCTGGKKADMDMYAAVLRAALARGERVKPGVRLYLQFGSQTIRRYAEDRGYLAIFEAAGAELIEPSCGACIRAGPGVSTRAEEVTVSAINRNYAGRSGPGQVYLASPWVVAASAIAGHIVHPAELESPVGCAASRPNDADHGACGAGEHVAETSRP